MLLDSEAEARTWISGKWGPDALADLDLFVALLRSESARQNLVSRASIEHLWVRHIADSAQLLDLAPNTPGVWLDLGSGAGFPGLIVAILDRRRDVRLVEQRKLRVTWMRTVVKRLNLSGCEIIEEKVEFLAPFGASVISARAFAPLLKTLTLGARFSTEETCWLLPKGTSAGQELCGSQHLRQMFHVKPSITDPAAGIIVGWGKVEAGYDYGRDR